MNVIVFLDLDINILKYEVIEVVEDVVSILGIVRL